MERKYLRMLRLAVATKISPTENVVVIDRFTLGKRVRDLRLKKSWTQQQLAAAAHVTANTVRGLERAYLDTRRPKFEAIAAALGTTPDLLLRADQPITPDHPLLEGLNDDDLRLAQAYSRARTPTRLRVERLLLTGTDAGLLFLERFERLDDHAQTHLRLALEQYEKKLADERTKEKRSPTNHKP